MYSFCADILFVHEPPGRFQRNIVPAADPVERRWVFGCEDAPSLLRPVQALADAEVGIPPGLGTIVGNVCERGKFLE